MVRYSLVLIKTIHTYLSYTDFSECYHLSDVEFTWSFIKSVINSAIEQCVPSIKIGPNEQAYHIECVCTLEKVSLITI